MFAGIVEESAEIVSLETSSEPYRLVVRSGLDHSDTNLGDSICISGVCLTVVKQEGSNLHFDLAAETVRRSSLGSLKRGDMVNLERSLSLGQRIHGHLVFGHVDAVAKLAKRENDGNTDRLSFSYPKELSPYLAPKGSISVSGTSLTLGEVSADTFSVYIVPHTSEVTTLSTLSVGDQVNIEVDMLARYVHSSLEGLGVSTEQARSDENLDRLLKRHGLRS